MMKIIPSKNDNPDGLHRRYTVTKADGKNCDPRAVYFVLRLDSLGGDSAHISACRAAARAYADYVQSGAAPHLSQVGDELRKMVTGFDIDDNF
jgi:hypothetical protein